MVYGGWERDPTRMDAIVIEVQLFQADQYFQFVTISVPSPELRRFIGPDPNVTRGRLWWHIIRATRPQLIDAIKRREIPQRNPSCAYGLQVGDLDAAIRDARADKDEAHEAIPGEVVDRFSIVEKVEPKPA